MSVADTQKASCANCSTIDQTEENEKSNKDLTEGKEELKKTGTSKNELPSKTVLPKSPLNSQVKIVKSKSKTEKSETKSNKDLTEGKAGLKKTGTSKYVLPSKTVLPKPPANSQVTIVKSKSKTEKSETKLERNVCNPDNCDKLNFTGKKKNRCCNDKLCPTNDPTSSTYNFLKNIGMCCKTRGCQLAAKICDIYETLVSVELDDADIGEKQYHYLAKDVATDSLTSEEIVGEIVSIRSIPDDKTITVITMDSIPDKHGSSGFESDDDEPASTASRRKSSAVSWGPKAHSLHTSASQDEVIQNATAQADRFRQTPMAIMQKSVFADISQPALIDDSELTVKGDSSEEIHNKSLLDSSINKFDSGHKQPCCSSLTAKFKKKKKQKIEQRGSSVTDWRMSSHHNPADRRKPNLSNLSVTGKNADIIV